METIDPATGRPLPADAIQRILFLAPKVHIYNIPPLASTRGHTASSWTTSPSRQIFTARLRIIETAIPPTTAATATKTTAEETVKTDILLEDPSTNDLFAAAPYTSASAVEQALDSSRFFALTVQGEGGRRAVLGLGFEERADAFDFSVALQEVRKTLGLLSVEERKLARRRDKEDEARAQERSDFSLKEGQTITVNFGGRSSAKGRRSLEGRGAAAGAGAEGLAAFALPPPPLPSSSGGAVLLPPPPSAQEVKAQKRLSQTTSLPPAGSIEDLGFDDGEFGEFQ